MARASNYSAGDTVIFNRQYKTLGVERGDEREVERMDYDRNTAWLDGGNGNLMAWRLYQIAAAKGGSGGLQERGDGASRGRSGPLDAQRSGLGTRERGAAVVESIEKKGVPVPAGRAERLPDWTR